MRDRPERVQVAETFCRPKKISPGSSPFWAASSEASRMIERKKKGSKNRTVPGRQDTPVGWWVGIEKKTDRNIIDIPYFGQIAIRWWPKRTRKKLLNISLVSEFRRLPPHMPPALTIATTTATGCGCVVSGQEEASHLPHPLVLHRTGCPFSASLGVCEADFCCGERKSAI